MAFPYTDGLVQDCIISIANALPLEILQSCTGPSIYCPMSLRSDYIEKLFNHMIEIEFMYVVC